MNNKMIKIRHFGIIFILLFFIYACGKIEDLGTQKRPINFYFVPSANLKVLKKASEGLTNLIEKDTGLKIKITIPKEYIKVIKAFSKNNVEVAFINTFSYLLAHELYGAQAELITLRGNNDETYQGQIVTHIHSGVSKLKDLQNRKFAFMDKYSTSGFVLPAYLLKKKNIKPFYTHYSSWKEILESVYKKEVAAGATFYRPKNKKGQIQDARKYLLKKYPDIVKKVKILAKTPAIPNEPIAFRKNIPANIKEKLIQSLLKISNTKKGKKLLMSLYDITGMKRTNNARYSEVRKIIKALGKEFDDFVPGGSILKTMEDKGGSYHPPTFP